MDYQMAMAVALPIVTIVGGWILSVEKRLTEIVAIKEDVADVRGDVKDIYKHLLGKESNGRG